MLTAAERILAEDGGLTVSLEHISFEDVVREAGVSRSTAYRLWPTKDQFYDDLLLELAGPEWAGTAAFDHKTIELANHIVDQHVHLLATEEGRLQLLVLASRLGSQQNFDAVTASGEWRMYVTLTAAVVSMADTPTKAQLTEAMKQADHGFLSRMAEFYTAISARIGFRLRPEFGDDFRLLAAVGASVVEGLGIRQLVSPELVERKFDRTIFSEYGEGEWSLPSLGFTAVLMTMIEMDPDFVPPPDAGHRPSSA